MALSDVIEKANQQLAQRKQAIDLAHDSSIFNENLQVVFQYIGLLRLRLEAAQEASMLKLMGVPPIQDLLDELFVVLENIQQDLNDRYFRQANVNQLKKLVDNTTNICDQTWRASVTDSIKALVSSMDTLGTLLPQSKTWKSSRNEIYSWVDKMPREPLLVDNFAFQLKTGQDVVNKAGNTPAIQEFIRKVSNKAACLGDVTEEVREWIEKNGLISRIGLHFQG